MGVVDKFFMGDYNEGDFLRVTTSFRAKGEVGYVTIW
jgi:hypothetical protein